MGRMGSGYDIFRVRYGFGRFAHHTAGELRRQVGNLRADWYAAREDGDPGKVVVAGAKYGAVVFVPGVATALLVCSGARVVNNVISDIREQRQKEGDLVKKV